MVIKKIGWYCNCNCVNILVGWFTTDNQVSMTHIIRRYHYCLGQVTCALFSPITYIVLHYFTILIFWRTISLTLMANLFQSYTWIPVNVPFWSTRVFSVKMLSNYLITGQLWDWNSFQVIVSHLTNLSMYNNLIQTKQLLSHN